jgi:hypothetical protein
MSNETIYREKLATNPCWAIRGLLRIFQNQTADEQLDGAVRHNNGIGFTGTDAPILTSFAYQVMKKLEWVKSKNLPVCWDKMLSEKQMNLVFKKMPKYSKQLLRSVKE